MATDSVAGTLPSLVLTTHPRSTVRITHYFIHSRGFPRFLLDALSEVDRVICRAWLIIHMPPAAQKEQLGDQIRAKVCMVWCPSYPLDRNRCDQVVAAGSGAG
jgi:hypothetical protein